MDKGILFLIAATLIVLASLNTFLEFSDDLTGNFAAAPSAVTNAYTVLTFLVMFGIAFFMIFRK